MTLTNYYEILNDIKIGVFYEKIDNKTLAQKIAKEKIDDEPFIILNLTILVKKFFKWKKYLPRILPFYAVKCNDDPMILKTLANLGCGFDCASKNEINKIMKYEMVGPEKIIYANPCKTKSFIVHADQVGVHRMTFDNVEELFKVKELHCNPLMILRIAVNDPTAQCQLGIKFGCDPISAAPELLRKAKELDVKVIGVSFHVGSGCHEPKTFETAIEHARNLFDYGKELGHSMKVLDIGGGFPGVDTEEISLPKIAAVINSALEKHFPNDDHYEIIAEPGRFFASAPVSVTANIISSVKVPASRITQNEADDDKDGYMYYMNDGVYGSFNCKLFDHYSPVGEPLFPDLQKDEKKFHCTVWGPTCDGLDQVEDSTEMRQMNVGEWVYYRFMGAYTSVASSTFNGFEKPKTFYFIDEFTLRFLNRSIDN